MDTFHVPYFRRTYLQNGLHQLTTDTHCANDLAPRTSAFALVFPKYTFYVPNPCILGTRPVLPCTNASCCKLVGTKSVFDLCYSRYLSVVGCSSGGTFIPVSLIAVVPTVLEKSAFYGYLAVASVSLGLPTQFVHCCLAATRAFMPASLIVIPYTILEISKFLGQLPVDDDDDDENCQLNAGITSLRSKLTV